MLSLQGKRVTVTGGAGFLGSAVRDGLIRRGVADIVVPRSRDCDLRDKDDCRTALKGSDIVIHCAAHVGGITLNADQPADLFYDNAMMGMNVIHQAHELGLEKVVVIGTANAYPTGCPVPFREDDLWNGYPREVTAPYGMAKKMLIPQASAYRQQYGLNAIHLILTNLYGPGDDFDPVAGQVVPSLVCRMVKAKERNDPAFSVWGTGIATRVFLFVRDAAAGILLATEQYDEAAPVNLGSGVETPVAKLVTTLQDIIGYKGEIVWDRTKPDGQLRIGVDTERAEKEFGFTAKTPLADGLKETVHWYLRNR